MTAYHEAGHALVGRTLPGVTVPHKLSIVPRGSLLGWVWQAEEKERAMHSRSMLINQMAMMLAGRAAEDLIFGEMGSGAASDLSAASALARKMVCEYGMSEALGNVSYTGNGVLDPAGTPRYSEEEAQLIGTEVRRLVDEAHDLAIGVLRDSRATLDRIAETLLERETLSAVELEAIIDDPLVPSR